MDEMNDIIIDNEMNLVTDDCKADLNYIDKFQQVRNDVSNYYADKDDDNTDNVNISNKKLKSNKCDLKKIIVVRPNCYSCCKTFNTNEALFSHLKEHKCEDGKRFKCPVCLVHFDTNGYVVAHIESVHAIVIREKIIQPSSSKYMRMHFKPDSEHFKPDSEHIRNNLVEKDHKPSTFSCKVCAKEFKRKIQLNDHLKIHFEEKQFVCETCGHRFLLKRSLLRHLKTHLKPDTCSVCGKKVAVLITHMKTHKAKKYTCEKCNKVFTSEKSYNIHILSHIEGKKFSCEMCNIKFMTRSNLSRHLQRHSGVRPYPCVVCGQKFATKWDLINRHMKQHTGDFPYKCDICQKGFLTKGHLDVHQTSHTGKRDFECKFCNKRFGYIANLRFHYKNSHPKKTPSRPQVPRYRNTKLCIGFQFHKNVQK